MNCTINNNGTCNECGCPTESHTHATIEYYKERIETVAYTNLAAEIANMDKSITGGKADVSIHEKRLA